MLRWEGQIACEDIGLTVPISCQGEPRECGVDGEIGMIFGLHPAAQAGLSACGLKASACAQVPASLWSSSVLTCVCVCPCQYVPSSTWAPVRKHLCNLAYLPSVHGFFCVA